MMDFWLLSSVLEELVFLVVTTYTNLLSRILYVYIGTFALLFCYVVPYA